LDLDGRFRVPLAPVVPLIGAALRVSRMNEAAGRDLAVLHRVVGARRGVVYALYGYRNSRLRCDAT
jgi:hypothetical protein